MYITYTHIYCIFWRLLDRYVGAMRCGQSFRVDMPSFHSQAKLKAGSCKIKISSRCKGMLYVATVYFRTVKVNCKIRFLPDNTLLACSQIPAKGNEVLDLALGPIHKRQDILQLPFIHLRSHPHTPGSYPGPFTKSFWRNFFLCGFGEVWSIFSGYVSFWF